MPTDTLNQMTSERVQGRKCYQFDIFPGVKSGQCPPPPLDICCSNNSGLEARTWTNSVGQEPREAWVPLWQPQGEQAPSQCSSHWPLPDLPSPWPLGGGPKRPWEFGYHYPALIWAHLVQWLGADLRVTPVSREPVLSWWPVETLAWAHVFWRKRGPLPYHSPVPPPPASGMSPVKAPPLLTEIATLITPVDRNTLMNSHSEKHLLPPSLPPLCLHVMLLEQTLGHTGKACLRCSLKTVTTPITPTMQIWCHHESLEKSVS